MLVFIVILLKININLASLIGATFTGLIGLYGIGIAFSSLSLVFKDIKAIISLFKVGFIYCLNKMKTFLFLFHMRKD
jgi:hypothetical protein